MEWISRVLRRSSPLFRANVQQTEKVIVENWPTDVHYLAGQFMTRHRIFYSNPRVRPTFGD
jgi:hypothetical protein